MYIALIEEQGKMCYTHGYCITSLYRKDAVDLYQPHITIVGAGIVGLSTALALLQQGLKKVTVLEQGRIGHRYAASSGYSRLLRYEYGADKFYSEMVYMSMKRWKLLERQTQQRLYTPTGILTLGREDDSFTHASYAILRELGYAPECLSQEACYQRFPQFATQEYDFLLYNREAGMLHASACLQALKARVIGQGGIIRERCRVATFRHSSPTRPLQILLENGEQVATDRVVFAVGPWVHQLLHDLDLPVKLTQQYLLYLTDLPYEIFGLHTFPAFMADLAGDDLYGFPMSKDGGRHAQYLKVASHRAGILTGPGRKPVVDENRVRQIMQSLIRLIPAMQQARLAHIDANGIYDISPDEHFILDHFPGDSRVVFATGLSGHGFKFGLLLGEILASLVCESEPAIPIERFSLKRFAYLPARQSPSIA